MIRLIESEGYTMARTVRLSIAVLILAVTFGAAGWVYGQAAQGPQFPSQQPDPNAPIISGSDIGFRVDRQRTQDFGRLTGTWVVRVNGQWTEPESALRSRPLSTR
jgi:hypothetical protein